MTRVGSQRPSKKKKKGSSVEDFVVRNIKANKVHLLKA